MDMERHLPLCGWQGVEHPVSAKARAPAGPLPRGYASVLYPLGADWAEPEARRRAEVVGR